MLLKEYLGQLTHTHITQAHYLSSMIVRKQARKSLEVFDESDGRIGGRK